MTSKTLTFQASRLAASSTLAMATGLVQPGFIAHANAQEASGLETIVVTARKRAENLQETPISITAATGEALEIRQIFNSQGIAEITPNLVATQGFNATGNGSVGSYFIRGIGQIDFLLNTDPGVGLYVDGVYIARAFGSIMDLINLERVEVLRGPQGTLFGRNTIGGAISMVSKAPSDEFSLDGRLTLGNLDRVEMRASVNAPITDAFFVSASLFHRDVNGYVDRITDGTRLGDDQTFGARLAARWVPTDTFTIDLALDYSDFEGTSAPQNIIQINETAAFPSVINGALIGPPCVPPPSPLDNPACLNSQYEADDLFQERGDFQNQVFTEVFGASLTVEFEAAEWLTIKSITGYRETDAFGARDGDHTPFVIQNTTDTWSHEQFSQEVQFLGTLFDERLSWILGAYYFEEQGDNINDVTFPPLSLAAGGSVDNDNFALFAQSTFDISDKLSLTAGIRWTDETKRFLPVYAVTNDVFGTALPPGVPTGVNLFPDVESEFDISEVNPMVNLAYQWNDGLMTYATYSQGFKSGGFNQRLLRVPADLMPPAFAPEFVDSFEVGWKWDAASMPLRVNGAVFYTDYQDLQVQFIDGVQPLTGNAASATIKGFELEWNYAPVEGLLITGGLGFTDAEYDELAPQVVAFGITLDSEFAQIPKWTTNIGVAYEYDIGDTGTMMPRVDFIYQSGTFMDAINTASLEQEGYLIVNAALRFELADSPFSFTAFGRNLTDKVYFTGGLGALGDIGIAEASISRPREWGVSLEVNF